MDCLRCEELCEQSDAVECSRCSCWLHMSCISNESKERLPGDIFFSLVCARCNTANTDELTRQRIPWVNALLLALYNLHLANTPSNQGYYHWKLDICQFISDHWTYLHGSKAKKKRSWQGIVASSLSAHLNHFFSSGWGDLQQQGWWKLRSFEPPCDLLRLPMHKRRLPVSQLLQAAKHAANLPPGIQLLERSADETPGTQQVEVTDEQLSLSKQLESTAGHMQINKLLDRNADLEQTNQLLAKKVDPRQGIQLLEMSVDQLKGIQLLDDSVAQLSGNQKHESGTADQQADAAKTTQQLPKTQLLEVGKGTVNKTSCQPASSQAEAPPTTSQPVGQPRHQQLRASGRHNVLRGTITSLENAIALKKKRDSLSLESNEKKQTRCFRAKRKAHSSHQPGRQVKRSKAAQARPIDKSSAVETNRRRTTKPTVASTFENPWELVQVRHRFLSIPKQQRQEVQTAATVPAQIKTYSRMNCVRETGSTLAVGNTAELARPPICDTIDLSTSEPVLTHVEDSTQLRLQFSSAPSAKFWSEEDPTNISLKPEENLVSAGLHAQPHPEPVLSHVVEGQVLFLACPANHILQFSHLDLGGEVELLESRVGETLVVEEEHVGEARKEECEGEAQKEKHVGEALEEEEYVGEVPKEKHAGGALQEEDVGEVQEEEHVGLKNVYTKQVNVQVYRSQKKTDNALGDANNFQNQPVPFPLRSNKPQGSCPSPNHSDPGSGFMNHRVVKLTDSVARRKDEYHTTQGPGLEMDNVMLGTSEDRELNRCETGGSEVVSEDKEEEGSQPFFYPLPMEEEQEPENDFPMEESEATAQVEDLISCNTQPSLDDIFGDIGSGPEVEDTVAEVVQEVEVVEGVDETKSVEGFNEAQEVGQMMAVEVEQEKADAGQEAEEVEKEAKDAAEKADDDIEQEAAVVEHEAEYDVDQAPFSTKKYIEDYVGEDTENGGQENKGVECAAEDVGTRD